MFAGTNWRHPYGPSSSALSEDPVVHVSWRDARAFCAWDTTSVASPTEQPTSPSSSAPRASSISTFSSSSSSDERPACGTSQKVARASLVHKRLPTEVEWELACRGGLRAARFPWGDGEHDKEGAHERQPRAHRMNIWTGHFPDFNSADDGYPALAPVRSSCCSILPTILFYRIKFPITLPTIVKFCNTRINVLYMYCTRIV